MTDDEHTDRGEEISRGGDLQGGADRGPDDEEQLRDCLIASIILGGMALLFGGVGLIFGMGRQLPVPETPTRDDMLLAYISILLIGTAVVALVYLAFLWLIRPFGIDERSPTPEEG